jgi:hypothetical protein
MEAGGPFSRILGTSGNRKTAYRTRREGRACSDARVAELATRELAMHPAVRLDAKVGHGCASLGCVWHPASLRPAPAQATFNL